MTRPRKPAQSMGPILIEDDDEVINIDLTQEEAAEHDLFREISDVIDLTEDFIVETRTQIREPLLRTKSTYIFDNGTVVKPGMTLQIHDRLGQHRPAPNDEISRFRREYFKAEFFRIEKIICPPASRYGTNTAEPIFRGYVYSRAKNVESRFPKKLNEVVLIANVDSTDPRPWQQQALVDLKPSIFGPVRDLRITNATYPEFKYDALELRKEHHNKQAYIERHGPLVCRHSYVRYFIGPEKRRQNKPHQWAIIRVDEDGVVDPTYKKTSEELIKAWRGGRRLGGSYIPKQNSSKNPLTKLYPGQRYTTGDMFAGAGGVARGMTMAGAHLTVAVDNWKAATDSLRANFPSAQVQCVDVTEFINNPHINYFVDILHLSPPCQVWSPAHTIPGKNDEMNEAILFSCSHILKKMRPRLFTLEQTFGILHDRFSSHFSRLMADFTEAGYSTRWQVVNLAAFGVPQPRKRLIILGAGPGESLPDFPQPTHGLDTRAGMKPFVTVRQALQPLESNDHYYDIDHALVPLRVPKTPWDPDRLLSNTITTDGGKDNYHWDGTRQFTIAEFALLQGFPLEHKFVGSRTDKKRQIGNAFPPKVVKTFYEHLIKWLDKSDGIRNRPNLPPIGAIIYELEPIELDDDEPEEIPLPVVRRLLTPISRLKRSGWKRSNSTASTGSGTSWGDPMEID